MPRAVRQRRRAALPRYCLRRGRYASVFTPSRAEFTSWLASPAAARWGSSGGALGHLLTADALSLRRASGANEQLRVAGIGVGGKGSGDIDQAGTVIEVVAVCDIDEQWLDHKGEVWRSAKMHFDYRKFIDEVAKNIDAVTVPTADHHAPAAADVVGVRGERLPPKGPALPVVFGSWNAPLSDRRPRGRSRRMQGSRSPGTPGYNTTPRGEVRRLKASPA